MTTKTELNEALNTEGLIISGVEKLVHTVKAETIASVNKDAVIAEQAARIEQLVAENSKYRDFINWVVDTAILPTNENGKSEADVDEVYSWACDLQSESPATDSVICEIQAEAIEEATKNVVISYYEIFDNGLADKVIALYEKAFLDYAKALRSGEVSCEHNR